MASSLKVAIVEDHNDLRHEMVDLFVAEGHIVSAFPDAESLRRNNGRMDLYIIDIGLPGEDGLSLARWIREQHQGARIFILTAHDENQKRIESFRVGIELFLAKPIDPNQLKAAVSLIAAHPDATVEAEQSFTLESASGILRSATSSIKLSSSEVALIKKLVDLRQLPLAVKDVAEALNVAPDQMHTGTLEARISILRKKFLEIGGTRNVIASVRKYGYKINASVTLR